MSPDQWKKLKELFAQAVPLESPQRAAFLREHCGDDAELREELESLLSHHSQASSFIEQPAAEKVASVILGKGTLSAGQLLAHYQILGSLGFGGMGEVYLALDTRLKRKIALKLLPADLTNNQQRLQRFEQEARAISALNHPNILTIYEVGKYDGFNCIATEYIDGVTWRKRVANEPTTIAQTVEIATQVAAALAAAHESGIVHRDIKPENVMLRRDGLVKVLDFGLAKTIETPSDSSASQIPTRLVATDPGTVMGTISYMSPEQTRGTDVDARTDVWSLGVVIYEMLTGGLPFPGQTTSDVIASILKSRPAPLRKVLPDAPIELERIVAKCLNFERDDRYPTAVDLWTDLKRLHQDLELEARLAGSAPNVATEIHEDAQPTQTVVEHTIISSRTSSPYRLLVWVIAGLLLLSAVGYFMFRSKQAAPLTESGPIDTLAVLPFANGSQNPDAEYLSDGITDSLINSLSQLPSLKVKSASSVGRYKGRKSDVQAVGKELNVRAVLVGELKQLNDQLLINVALVDVSDGHNIWGEQYARKPDDVLAIQRDITQEVTNKLRVKWTDVDKERLQKKTTDNPEAYRLYLKGRYHAVKMTPEDFDQGIQYFREAIQADPGYALAFSGLSFYYVQALDQILPPKEAMDKARDAAVQAIKLDDSVAEAHMALAYIYWQFDWDWSKAEREFQRAVELNPNSSEVHGSYGFFLVLMGRVDKGLAEVDKANDLSPLSLEMSLYVAPSYYFARRYPEAIDRAEKAIEFAPDFWLPHLIAGRAYERQGNLPAAITEYQKARSIDNNSSEILMDLGRAYALKGERAEAERVLKELQSRTRTSYVAPFQRAMVHFGLGDKDKGFAALEEAYEARSWYMTWLRAEPGFDSLRSDPRFISLVGRVGL
jgi:serine/threonine-protein kinase